MDKIQDQTQVEKDHLRDLWSVNTSNNLTIGGEDQLAPTTNLNTDPIAITMADEADKYGQVGTYNESSTIMMHGQFCSDMRPTKEGDIFLIMAFFVLLFLLYLYSNGAGPFDDETLLRMAMIIFLAGTLLAFLCSCHFSFGCSHSPGFLADEMV